MSCVVWVENTTIRWCRSFGLEILCMRQSFSPCIILSSQLFRERFQLRLDLEQNPLLKFDFFFFFFQNQILVVQPVLTPWRVQQPPVSSRSPFPHRTYLLGPGCLYHREYLVLCAPRQMQSSDGISGMLHKFVPILNRLRGRPLAVKNAHPSESGFIGFLSVL